MRAYYGTYAQQSIVRSIKTPASVTLTAPPSLGCFFTLMGIFFRVRRTSGCRGGVSAKHVLS